MIESLSFVISMIALIFFLIFGLAVFWGKQLVLVSAIVTVLYYCNY